MARNWRKSCPNLVKINQELALTGGGLYLLREIGPTAFLIQQQDKREPFKVCLGETHSCSCREHVATRDLCLHICWVLLKKFKLEKTDPMSYQTGLVPRELADCVSGARATAVGHQEPDKRRPKGPSTSWTDERTRLRPRPAQDTDHCPICLEQYDGSSTLSYCRYGCGNRAHLRCVEVLARHQKQESSMIKCPLCRGDFGTREELRQETLKDLQVQRSHQNQKPLPLPVHPHAECRLCLDGPPIRGNLYKCLNCPQVVVCAGCLKSNNFLKLHSGHGVAIKKSSDGRWIPMANSPTLTKLEQPIQRAVLPKINLKRERVVARSVVKEELPVNGNVPGLVVVSLNKTSHIDNH